MSERGLEFEETSKGIYHANIIGPVTDVHMHPRIFDPRFYRREETPNGKAGIHMYSQAALRAGFFRGLAMPNESLRIYSPDEPDQTELVPYPLTKPDRILAAANVIIQRSLMKTGLIAGVDREIIGLGLDNKRPEFTTQEVEKVFSSRYIQELAAALKIYGGETTGGYMIPMETIIPVAEIWHKHNEGKPVYLHLEDGAVGIILEQWPAHIPAHIAHVSSRQEFEPIIEAIDSGKNVTCEATPHHLFLTEATREAIGAYGCMKPTLKSAEDVKFLWDNLKYIHIFASDCAPHRAIDKVGIDGQGIDNPAFGVTNHDVFLPLFFQTIRDGRLTEQELYERIVTNPAQRFNLPKDRSRSRFELKQITAEEAIKSTEYGWNPFAMSPETPTMIGKIISQLSEVGRLNIVLVGSEPIITARPGYQNLIRF